MWRLDKDPHLGSTFANITVLDRSPDLAVLRRRLERATYVVRRLRQRVQPGPRRGTQRVEAQPHEIAVLRHHRREVADRAQRDQRAVRFGRIRPSDAVIEVVDDLVGDADRRRLGAVRGVHQFRVHDDGLRRHAQRELAPITGEDRTALRAHHLIAGGLRSPCCEQVGRTTGLQPHDTNDDGAQHHHRTDQHPQHPAAWVAGPEYHVESARRTRRGRTPRQWALDCRPL